MLAALLAANLPAHAVTPPKAPAPPGCSQYPGNYFGPFDYRTAPQQRRDIVEDFHFTPQVEQLRAGMTGPVGGDISYTLGAFPNHPRAIVAMMRLVDKLKQDPAPGAMMSMECYFLRGIRFAPDDLVFRMQYGLFLMSRNRMQDALNTVDVVAKEAGDNAFTHFNAGMLYFDMKEYDKALVQAHRVIALGFERPELRDKLKSVGRWVDPPAEAASAPASAASQ
ncbi:MAG: hypothetical protein C0460_14995 [Methylibium sp.]|nr:hypothetical protein [Methylibium sp.]MBY0367566.1 ABC transporter permease [Burkholderiaceae bacterium]